MAKIKINGDSSGYVELAAPNAAHNNTLELGPGTKILTDKNTHTGNIGIGTDNPAYNLEVFGDSALISGSSAANLILEDRGVADSSNPFFLLSSDGGDFKITTADRNGSGTTTNSTERLRITSDGTVQLSNLSSTYTSGSATRFSLYNDTNNHYGLHVGSSFDLNYNAGGSVASGKGEHIFHTAAQERLRITSGGNIGIGTITPNTGNPSGAKYLHIHNSATNNSNSPAEIYFTNANTGPSGGAGGLITFYNRGFYFWNYANDDLHFGTGGAERFKFDHSAKILDFISTSKIRLRGAASTGTTHAHLNIGSQGGANTDTRAIDIWGNWQDQESKSITWNHGTTNTNDMVCQQRVRYNQSPSTTVYEIGRFYNGQNTTAFPFQLQSTSTTTADLTIDGQIYNKNQSFVAYSTQSDNIQSSTKIDYTVSTSYAGVFNNSNSRFTAQRAGLYLFYVRHWFIAGQTGTCYLDMMKNGTSVKEFRVTHPTSSSEYETIQGTALVPMAVNDYMEVNGSAAGNASLHESSGTRHSEFSGFYVSG